MPSVESGNPQLEYNLAGGLLLTLNQTDFAELQQRLKDSGYSAACVLPFRALMKEQGIKSLHDSPLSIIHIEEAWNPTNEDNLTKAIVAGMLGYYNRFRGKPGANPILQDALFPSSATCDRLFSSLMSEFPKAKFISHQLNVDYPSDRLLVEINQGVGVKPVQLLDLARQKGIGLVFDPSHLLPSDKTISLPKSPTVKVNEWEKQFNYFSPQVEVVDINPPDKKKDVSELLSGRGVLKEVAQAVKEAGVNILRVEIPIPPAHQLPGLRPHTKGFEFLKDVGNALR